MSRPLGVRRAATLGATALLIGATTLGAVPASFGTPAPAAAPAVSQADQADILDRLRAVPEVKDLTEAAAPAGYRFFRFTFTQPVDHRHPKRGTFQQRLTLLHKDISRPMVMYTSGYYVSQNPSRSEPTQIVDGNQLSMEYRFFEPSRPANPDWDRQLTIWQAATDQHRVIEALKPIYDQHWLTTGGSKGGMTATYHRRFYPGDVDGTVPYVAPNDVDNDDDAYARFLARVGTDAQCRSDLLGVQRRILGPDRSWFRERTRAAATEAGETWDVLGTVDRAMEVAAMDLYFTFWQYTPQSECVNVPGADATNEEIWDWTQNIVPLTGYMDSTLEYYAPYYYQAAYQLGWYETLARPLRDVIRYGLDPVAAPKLVLRELRPVRFDRNAMADVDRWVRRSSTRMLYVYGGNDPWGAEAFSCGRKRVERRECSVHVVEGGTHGSRIANLPAAEQAAAAATLLRWAGVASSDPAAKALRKNGHPTRNPKLDVKPDYLERRPVR